MQTERPERDVGKGRAIYDLESRRSTSCSSTTAWATRRGGETWATVHGHLAHVVITLPFHGFFLSFYSAVVYEVSGSRPRPKLVSCLAFFLLVSCVSLLLFGINRRRRICRSGLPCVNVFLLLRRDCQWCHPVVVLRLSTFQSCKPLYHAYTPIGLSSCSSCLERQVE